VRLFFRNSFPSNQFAPAEIPVKFYDLSTPELDALLWRRIAELNKLRTEIQRRKGMEDIESQIARFPKKQRAFLLALLKSPHKRMSLLDLTKIVWEETDDPNTQVKPETIRIFVWRLGNSLMEKGLPLFIDEIKRENGDVYGYKIKKFDRFRKKSFCYTLNIFFVTNVKASDQIRDRVISEVEALASAIHNLND
jgi:hypothetical protein